MKTKHRSPIALFLLSICLLAWAGSASAANIIVEYVTVTVSSLQPTLQPTDTITIRNNGTLWVDNGANVATVAKLTIGEGTTAGSVLFSGTASTFVVTGDVEFGSGNLANSLDMAFLTPTTPHVLKVGGKFLETNAGRFSAGAATVEYYSDSAQTVTAQVGGSPVVYKHLTLSGSGGVGGTNSVKSFATGVSVQGTLTIAERAIPAGAPVSYGVLASLVYAGSVPQTTTGAEWPATPLPIIPITINNVNGVTLDSDKAVGAASPNSLILQSGVLKDNGRTLTVQGNITNNTAVEGKGKLVLGGSTYQMLSGSGTYGNVQLNNASGARLPIANIGQTLINGRLTVVNGQLTLPNSTSHQASLLTYGNPAADRSAGVYGSTNSIASPPNQSNVAFDPNASGTLTVPSKPSAVVAINNPSPTNSYGDTSVTITGTVSAPAGPPNFATFGNGPVNEQVTITITPAPPQAPVVQNTLVANDGTFTVTLNTTGIGFGTWPIRVDYAGGVNLAPNSRLYNSPPPASPVEGFTVTPKAITVTPRNVSKVYGDADPSPLPYDYAPPLVAGDSFLGALQRTPTGESVGDYLIEKGTLSLNANYNLIFVTGKKLTINQKAITVWPAPASKNYGDPDPSLTYSNFPALVGSDPWVGTLSRASGANAGQYLIGIGTLNAGANYIVSLAPGNVYLTINPLAILYVFNNPTKVYGEPDPAFSVVSIIPGLVSGDQATGTVTRVSVSTTNGNVVGTYQLIRGTLNVTKPNNYVQSFSATNFLTIQPRPVIVSATSPSFGFGQNVPLSALVSYEAKTTGRGLITAQQNYVIGQQTLLGAVPTYSPPTPATNGSPQGPYPFTIASAGSDPNYAPVIATAPGNAGTVTITRAPLTITADNKTKVADGAVFTGYSATYVGFIPPDNPNTAFTNTLQYTGTAMTATSPGVYQIIPYGVGNTNYNTTFVPGWLAITALPGTSYRTGSETWVGSGGGGISNLTVMINQANDGSAGANPGWSLLRLTNTTTGTLTINSGASDPFRIDLVTLAGSAAGLAAKFDPTRPYSWEIVRTAQGVINFTNDSQFVLNYQGANLFQNPVFGGKFDVRQGGNSLYVDYWPVGPQGGTGWESFAGLPAGYTVGPVLAYMTNGSYDVDVLYLKPSALSITPQQTVTIDLNVANLKQSIVGVQAYVNFDSRFFIANASGPGAPQVAPGGGGVWDTPVYRVWNTGGDLDTVMAVNISNTTGTQADGTVARITLTPTRTATGKSRVVFRADGAPGVLPGSPNVLTAFQPVGTSAASVLPARVMTDEVTVVLDNARPVIGAITATQMQPHSSTPVDVKNGTVADREQTVATSAGVSESTASGPVVITINASDAGVGLSGPPVLTLTRSGQPNINVPCTTPNATVGPFVYLWNVPPGVDNGTWSANVTATDTITSDPPFSGPNITNYNGAFTLLVNTIEVAGVVELEEFKGTNRSVTFKIGDGPGGASWNTTSNTWNLSLNWISGPILNAGAFQNRVGMANKVAGSPDSVSAWLRNGELQNLPALAARLKGMTLPVDAFVHLLIYGDITNLKALANQLTGVTQPTRAVDADVVSLLSSATVTLLAQYQAAGANPPAPLAAALKQALLDDFNNNIVLMGASFYNPVRFASVALSGLSLSLLNGSDYVSLNRSLLQDAYSQYDMGVLRAQTAQLLSQWTSGDDAALAAALLREFTALTASNQFWPADVNFALCLYNEQNFLGVTLAPATVAKLDDHRPGSELTPATEVVLLNQMLLQDAYSGIYSKPPLRPQTVADAVAGGANFVPNVTTDLNSLINSGSTIYTEARFGPTSNFSGELAQLLANSNKTPAQQIRENRLLLEYAYDAELSKSVLAPYRLVGVLANTAEVSAKTAWNLRVMLPVTTAPGAPAAASFVNDGVPGPWSANDKYLRGGDLNGGNQVNLVDYNLLRAGFPSSPAADINGDGIVNAFFDYSQMARNWGMTGSNEVQ